MKKLLLAFFIFLAVLLYVWQRVNVIEMGYRIEALERERKELLQKNKALLIEAASLGSPQRIEEIAISQLGMVRPSPGQMVFIRETKRLESKD